MKKITILLLAYFALCQFALTQVQLDSIFTSNGSIAVNIVEISEDAVKFSYPGEELVNSIYKNTVFKIKHKSGRVEVFNESSSFKVIKGSEDWEKVSITRVESEIKGLFKLEEVTSGAFGVSPNRINDRAFKKLKIEAAMLGGNIIYFLEKQTGQYNYGIYTQTNISGVAYSNTIPNFDDFKKIVNNKSEFEYLELQYLENNAKKVKTALSIVRRYNYDGSLNTTLKMVGITDVRNENGFIMVKTNQKGKDTVEYRITYFDDEKIVLMYRDKKKIYNLILKR